MGERDGTRAPTAARPAALADVLLDKLRCLQAKLPQYATRNDWYMALALAVRDCMLANSMTTVKSISEPSSLKVVAYLSAEFLTGPHLGNSLVNLGLWDAAREAVSSVGQDLATLVEHEEEPGLGNGGLGRLAACYMDSLATLNVPAIGYGIRYEFGIFDQAISWFDWQLVERHADIRRFVTLLNAYRRRRDPSITSARMTLNELLDQAQIQWSGVDLNCPDWSEHSHSLAITLESPRGHFLLHGIFNAYWEPLAFEVPTETSDQKWQRCIDTALASPHDISPIEEAVLFTGTRYVAQPRSVVVLALGLRTTVQRDRRPNAADWRQ